MATRVCSVCRLPTPAGQKLKRCTRCRSAVRYCSVEYQRVDWPTHQAVCQSPTAAPATVVAPSPAAAASAPRRPLVLSADLVAGVQAAREFVLRGARPWVVDLKDGQGLGALESHAKMLLLIEVLKTRHAYAFEEVALDVGGGAGGSGRGGGGGVTGRFHLF